MQNSKEFKQLAKIIEYWNDKLEVNTELLVSGLVFECLLIVSSEKEAKEIDKWLHDPVKVLTLDEMQNLAFVTFLYLSADLNGDF